MSDTYIGIQSAPSHADRLFIYMTELFNIDQQFDPLTNLKKGLVFISGNPHEIIPVLLEDQFFRRYLHRIYVCTHITEDLNDFDWNQIEWSGNISRIQVFPNHLIDQVFPLLPHDAAEFDLVEFNAYLNVVSINGRYGIGLCTADLYYAKKDDAEDSNHMSRAYFKIKEAIERYSIDLPEDSVAIDIGASPGGWSEYLIERVGKVIAIDPAEMKITAPNLEHMRMKIQDAIDHIEDNAADLVACDINCLPYNLFPLLSPMIEKMKPGAYLITTLKLQARNASSIDKKMERIIGIFKSEFPDFELVRTQWLLSNAKERCLIARKNTTSQI